MVDFTVKGNSGVPSLSSSEAQEVYSLIKEFGNADNAFKSQGNSAFYNKHFEIVDKEVDRLFNEMTCKLSGCFVVKEAVPPVYDEDGEVVSEGEPVEFFKVTTETAFKNSLSSDLLDTDEVYLDFKNGLSWSGLKNKFVAE